VMPSKDVWETRAVMGQFSCPHGTASMTFRAGTAPLITPTDGPGIPLRHPSASRSGFLASGGRGVHGPSIGGYGTGLLLRSVDGGGLGHN